MVLRRINGDAMVRHAPFPALCAGRIFYEGFDHEEALLEQILLTMITYGETVAVFSDRVRGGEDPEGEEGDDGGEFHYLINYLSNLKLPHKIVFDAQNGPRTGQVEVTLEQCLITEPWRNKNSGNLVRVCTLVVDYDYYNIAQNFTRFYVQATGATSRT